MRVLVTGGAGFIGSHTVEALVRLGHNVTILDDFSTGKEENLESVKDKISLVRGSLLDRGIGVCCRNIDAIIHLAAISSVQRSIEDPFETRAVNVSGTASLLKSASSAGVKRFVFASSAAIYGHPKSLPIMETAVPCPLSPYGSSKLAAERYGQGFCSVFKTEFVPLRYFNVFGPRQDPASPYSGVLTKFIDAFRKNQPVTIYGDGEQSRDFVFIDNVVQANIQALTAKGISGKPINIGSGERYSLNDILKIVSVTFPLELRIIMEPKRRDDIRDSHADILVARELLGYSPEIDFQQGLRRTWEAMQ